MRITVDYRERSSGLVELLQEHCHVEITTVRHGDYLINDRVTVERKTSRDFLVSLVDLRLFKQIANLKKHCSNPLLLLEGDPCQTGLDFTPQAIRGALISIQAIWNLPIIRTDSKDDSSDVMLTIAMQDEASLADDALPLRGGYRPKKLRTRQLYKLQGLPEVGPTLAKRLLARFKSVERVMTASADELTEVEGIGKATATRIREALCHAT